MRQFLLSGIFIASIALFSCHSKNNGNNQELDVADAKLMLEEPPSVSDKKEVISERKIIKQGEIKFETGDVNKTKGAIIRTVNDLGGYISTDNVFDYQDRLSHRIVIRIPAERFDTLLDRISESALKMDSKNIDVLDVTEEFIDVEVRLKTKKELETRYLELLVKAKTVEEILKIEKEIGALRSEIESMEGRFRYLKDRIALSTLTVEYYQRTSSTFGFSSKFTQALSDGWDWLLMFLIGITHLWTFILFAIIAIVFYKRVIKKRKPKNP